MSRVLFDVGSEVSYIILISIRRKVSREIQHWWFRQISGVRFNCEFVLPNVLCGLPLGVQC
jgi:hypothetical protein